MRRRRIGQLLLVVGFVALIFGAWAGAQYRTATARRLFFVDPFGMAAGADGRVYVGVDRREVHAYTDQGQPVAAWTVALDAGRFRLRVLEAGPVEVALEDSPERLVYEPEGRLISRHPDPGAFDRIGPARDQRVETADGVVFVLSADGLARSEAGHRTLIVPVPRVPLVWLGSRPIRPLTALLFTGTFGLLVGTVLTAAKRPGD